MAPQPGEFFQSVLIYAPGRLNPNYMMNVNQTLRFVLQLGLSEDQTASGWGKWQLLQGHGVHPAPQRPGRQFHLGNVWTVDGVIALQQQ
ncbi:hypothetical protein [Paraburkholderia sp. 40]|uniref:hypothetical protein n=1 Tax=Paraburkholderia sp. 40 TaxID=2991059 RepID=UPI003D203988